MRRKLILIAVVSFITTQAYSQIDNQFSAFGHTKVQINPAAAGFFKGKYKFFANYRSQWWSIREDPMTSYSASFDGRVYEDQREGRFVGGGLFFANDVTGDLRYQQLNISVPVNYAIRLDDYNTLAGGIAPGYFQRSINNNVSTWDNQWSNTDGFITTNPSGEQIFNDQFLVGRFDLSAGLYWEFEYDDYISSSLGVSGSHLTVPRVNFLPLDDRAYRSLNVHYFGSFGREDFPLTFKPSVMWSVQGPNNLLVLGTTIDFLLRGESKMTGYYNRTSLEIGTHFRYNDAVIASMAIHSGNFSVGAAYDFTVSSLSNVTGVQGATEFFLFYRVGKARGRGQLELVEPE